MDIENAPARNANVAGQQDGAALALGGAPPGHQDQQQPLPPLFKVLRVLSWGTAFFNAAGYGIVSYSEALTAGKELGLIGADPSYLKQPKHFLLVGVIPLLAAIGVVALNITENNHLFGATNRDASMRERFKNLLEGLKKYPVPLTVASVAAVAEGVIFFSNLGYILNEVDISIQDEVIYGVGTAVASIVSVQFALLNIPHLIKQINEGYGISDYTNHIQSNILKFLARAYVNIPPVLSALTMGALATSESYALSQFLMRQLEPPNEADRLAWMPATMLGLIYTACHLALNGPKYKEFLARPFRDSLQLTTKDIRKVLLSPIPLAFLIIGFGALDEMAFALIFGEPADPGTPEYSEYQKIYHEIFPLAAKLAVFALPISALAVEAYAVECRSLMELFRWENRQNNAGQNVQNDSFYTLDKFVTDALLMATTAGTKYLLDWWYIPKNVDPEDMTLQQAAISALLLSAVSLGFRLGHGYVFPKSYLSDAISRDMLEPNNAPMPAGDAPVQARLSNTTTATRSFLLASAVQSVLVGAATCGAEYLGRYLLFDSVPGEEENRLDSAQMLGALVGGITAIFLHRNGRKIVQTTTDVAKAVKDVAKAVKNKAVKNDVREGAVSISSSIYSFFGLENKNEEQQPLTPAHPADGHDNQALGQ